MNIFTAALISAAVLAAPAAASANSNHREPVSVAVSTSGLDLSRPEHVQRLRNRVERAIAAACNPDDRLYTDMKPDWRCRQEMGANAEIAMNRLIGSPASRVASN